MTFILVSAFIVLITGAYSLSRFLASPQEPNEPPLIPSGIPFLGHLLGMIRHGSSYYGRITKKYNLPIFTLGVPRGKIYIVNSPRLITAIDRRSKTISFAPYVVQFAQRILAPSEHAVNALAEDLLEKNGPVGLRPETLKVMHDSLMPGDNLDAITRVMLQGVTRHLNSINAASKGKHVKLFDWARKFVTRASTDAIYGTDENPFQEDDVYDALWTIDEQFILLGLNLVPDLVAPRASRARKHFFNAMHRYYLASGPKSASSLVQSRNAINLKYGVSQTDTEHFNLSVSYGLLVNTVPGTAWVLYYVYSDALLLSKLRRDFEPFVRRDGNGSAIVDLQDVISRYQLLDSLVREVLRVRSTNASGRVVLEDTMIDDQYLLKKDAVLLIPSAELHNSTAAWGPTAPNFDPERFLKLKSAQGVDKVPASAYRAFGSGASVCPGRHFAMNEIMAILVIMVLRFDIEPTLGHWYMPKTKSHITTSIMTPIDDIDVQISERESSKGTKWTFAWKTKENTE